MRRGQFSFGALMGRRGRTRGWLLIGALSVSERFQSRGAVANAVVVDQGARVIYVTLAKAGVLFPMSLQERRASVKHVPSSRALHFRIPKLASGTGT